MTDASKPVSRPVLPRVALAANRCFCRSGQAQMRLDIPLHCCARARSTSCAMSSACMGGDYAISSAARMALGHRHGSRRSTTVPCEAPALSGPPIAGAELLLRTARRGFRHTQSTSIDTVATTSGQAADENENGRPVVKK